MNKVIISDEQSSLQRIDSKCIDCGQCLEVCKTCNGLKDGDCVHCGACILKCPMGALVPKYNYKEVLANLHDEEKMIVASVSPAVRVSIGDEFGYPPGAFLEEKLVGVLKDLGFDYVLDTTFGADLTVMEEASEFIERLKQKKKPMFTSCCPSWVHFMKKYHESDLDLLSSAKSPIRMQGAMIKTYFAQLKNLNPEDIVTVFLTPCVSKKSEIENDCFCDYVITTSELAMMIREQSLDFKTVLERKFDSVLGKGTSSGLIFGTSGGVMRAVLRTGYFLLNHENPPQDLVELSSLKGTENFKEMEVDLKVCKVKVAVVYGLRLLNQLYDSLKESYDLIEVMTCELGCVGGGGQPIVPINKREEYTRERGKSLYQKDANETRFSYENLEIKTIYENFLEHPLSIKSKELLHFNHEER